MSMRSVDRSAVASKKDRSQLCTFTFADGRHCRTPRCSGHPHLCFFHARKEVQAQAAEQLGQDLSFFTSRHYLSALNLSAALARVFTFAAQGHIKPKTAGILAYTAQVLVQTLQLAQHEYIKAVGEGSWRNTLYSHIKDNCDYLNAQRSSFTPPPSSPASQSDPSPRPVPVPQPQPAPVTEPIAKPPAPPPVTPSPPPPNSPPLPAAATLRRHLPRHGTTSVHPEPPRVVPQITQNPRGFSLRGHPTLPPL